MKRLLQISNDTVQKKCLTSCLTLKKQFINMLPIIMPIIISGKQSGKNLNIAKDSWKYFSGKMLGR